LPGAGEGITTGFVALGETQLGIPACAMELLPLLLLAAAVGIETRQGVGGDDVGERQRGEVQPEQLTTLDGGGGDRILTEVGLSARWTEGVAVDGLVVLIGGANETC